jgi:hypothetical protein
MGSLADLIMGTSDDTQAIVRSEYPLGTFTGVNIDGLNPLHVAELHSILTDTDFNQIMDHYKPIAVGSKQGPWLVRFPRELLAAIANIAPHDLASVAAQWAATDRLQGEAWSDQDVENYLGQLLHFSQTATFEEKEVFLCVYS